MDTWYYAKSPRQSANSYFKESLKKGRIGESLLSAYFRDNGFKTNYVKPSKNSYGDIKLTSADSSRLVEVKTEFNLINRTGNVAIEVFSKASDWQRALAIGAHSNLLSGIELTSKTLTKKSTVNLIVHIDIPCSVDDIDPDNLPSNLPIKAYIFDYDKYRSYALSIPIRDLVNWSRSDSGARGILLPLKTNGEWSTQAIKAGFLECIDLSEYIQSTPVKKSINAYVDCAYQKDESAPKPKPRKNPLR